VVGIASALKAVNPAIRVYGAEPETAAPTALSFQKGAPQIFEKWEATFVDGAGGQSLFPRMWQRMQGIVDGAVVVSLDETRAAMRLMAEKVRVIAEGAGALALAAARSGKVTADGPIVCVVSGGNIDLKTFCEIVA
jgi:threonine dehydratase